MVTIVQKGAEILRETAKKVPLSEIKSKKIRDVIYKMKEGIDSRDDAVAIAAPQVGHSIRMFMVSKRTFIVGEENPDAKDAVFINPVIIKKSRKKTESEEGCLSADTWYGITKRAEKITIRAYNEKGERIERGASGLLAQVFQHEIDHLDGILFVDHATNLFQLEPQKAEENNEKK